MSIRSMDGRFICATRDEYRPYRRAWLFTAIGALVRRGNG